jgi:hypothetical protein
MRRLAELRSRVLWPLLGGLAIVSAALAVIIWLPLDAEIEADIRATLVGYETSREVAWPASQPFAPPVSRATETALAAETRREVARYTAGDALATFDSTSEVGLFLKAMGDGDDWIVTKWDAEVVHFDFVRQTLRGEVVVRAGVRRAHQIGRNSPVKDRIVARRWLWEDDVDVYEYTLRDDGERWKVVRVEHWGICGPDGQDVLEGRHST